MCSLVITPCVPWLSPQRLQVGSLTEVPYVYIRTEEDIMRILAGGTDEFCGLYEPMNRNA